MVKKILNFAKVISQMILVMALGFAISLGIYMSVAQNQKFPAYSDIRSLDNISDELDSKTSKTVNLSRHSILHVLSSNSSRGGPAKMSGTYVRHGDNFYVITAAHGIVGDCDMMFVATDEDNIYDCIRYIIVDQNIDYAIIQIEQVLERTPVNLSEVIPANREWLQETSVLTNVYYTGYPNGLGPLTFSGSIAGISKTNYLLLHSYAWPGSSGSGVFSRTGNMVGIVIALNVGLTAAGYDVLEDLVIVTPLFMIDWDTAYGIMDEELPEGDTGDTGN